MDLNQFLLTLPRTGRVVEVWQKGSGPDLVFLHGPFGIQAWTPELEQLSKSFRVTIPHFPGFGRSTGAEAIYDVMDALLHLADTFQGLKLTRPHLVGHSFGGMLAAEFAAVYPGEIGRLVLVSTLGFWNDATPVMDIFAIVPQDIGRFTFYDQRNPMAKAMSHVPGPDEPGLLDAFVSHVKGLAAAGRLMWPIPERGLSSRLDRLTMPVLIVWGENDRIASVHYARDLNKRIPGSKIRLFKEAGHMVHFEHPRPFANSIAQFLLDPALKAPERPPALREAIKMAPDRASQSEAMRIFVEKLQMKQAEKIAAAEGLTLAEPAAPTAQKVPPAKPPAKRESKTVASPKPSPKPAAAKGAPAKKVVKKAVPKRPASSKPASKKPIAKKPAKPKPKKAVPKKSPAKKAAKSVTKKTVKRSSKSAPKKKR